jgi:membrane-associated phospholipid phosphatase
MIRRPATIVVAASWLAASLLPADRGEAAPPRGSVYDVDIGVDLGATLSMSFVAVLIDYEKRAWTGLSPCSGRGRVPSPEEIAEANALPEDGGTCIERDMAPIDRAIIGNESVLAERLSNVLLSAMLAAPLAYAGGEAAFSDVEDRGRRFAEDALVAYESIAAAGLVTNVVKFAAQRPRPFTYDPEVPKEVRFDGDARLSFFSGHSSLTFAAATAISYTAFERHSGAEPWIAASTAYAIAGFVAYLRTLAGKHFVTDVLVGAAVGVATGLVITRVHARNGPEISSSGASLQAHADSRHDGARPALLSLEAAF